MKKITVGVFIDLDKTFDTVKNKILFDNLYHGGIRDLVQK